MVGDAGLGAWARGWADTTRAAFARDFVGPDGAVDNDTQSALGLALAFDLLPTSARAGAVDRLVADVRHHGVVTSGYLACHHVLRALTDAGRADVAWELVLGDGVPGWMHFVEAGATSLWERWDGWLPETGFHVAWLNSLNHASFGVVGEWLHATAAGLRAGSPGWSSVRFAPRPGGGVQWAEAWHDAPSGHARIHWELDGPRMRVLATTPVDAVLSWPDGTEQHLVPGEHDLVGAVTR